MDSEEYDIMFRIEDSHWWYRGMAKIYQELFKRFVPINKNQRILDAGCGTGATMQSFLANYGSVTGVDVSPIALAYCRKRDLKSLTCASVCNTPFASQSYDLVTSFDVLYANSIPDVPAAIREFERILTPGGFLVLRLPAYNWLRGRHDTAVDTARRFTTNNISKLLAEGGFSVCHRSYANAILFPLVFVKRVLENWFPHNKTTSDFYVPNRVVNRIFTALLGAEANLVARTGLPFGLSVAVIARKSL